MSKTILLKEIFFLKSSREVLMKTSVSQFRNRLFE